ncbi:hypothetical protein BgiBS90_018838, partial [Biomphalaria glabrata]
MQSSLLNGYITECQVTLFPVCDYIEAVDECYCKNTSGSLVEVIFNKTANIHYSNGTVRMNWPNYLKPEEISNEVKIPVIY